MVTSVLRMRITSSRARIKFWQSNPLISQHITPPKMSSLRSRQSLKFESTQPRRSGRLKEERVLVEKNVIPLPEISSQKKLDFPARKRRQPNSVAHKNASPTKKDKNGNLYCFRYAQYILKILIIILSRAGAPFIGHLIKSDSNNCLDLRIN